MINNYSFSFGPGELTQLIKQNLEPSHTGYLQIQLLNNHQVKARLWYIAVVQGLVVFSGVQKLSWTSFLEALYYQVPKLRTPQGKEKIEQLKQIFKEGQSLALGRIVFELDSAKLVSFNEIVEAMRAKIVSDIDVNLQEYSGEAKFIPEPELAGMIAPLKGFALNVLANEIDKRQIQWQQIRQFLPSVQHKLLLKPEALEQSNLETSKKQYLQKVVGPGKTMSAIATTMGMDLLQASTMFANLIKRGIVVVVPMSTASSVGQSGTVEIFIVDDSPMIVQQFRRLVESWGYRVNHSNNALTAVQSILQTNPSVIFIDINMPGLTGFELIKEIRRQSKISSIPLVLLTAERTVSNQWRAQWASCKFLAKPAKNSEVQTFQEELRQILQEVAPTSNKEALA